MLVQSRDSNRPRTSGLVDEISLHLAPVLFGSGTRLFAEVGEVTDLEPIEILPGGGAVHLRYQLKKRR